MKINKKTHNFSIILNVIFLFILLVFIVKFEVVKLVVNKINPTSESILNNTYYMNKVDIFNKMDINDNDIIFLGDSLTDNCEWSELFDNTDIKNRGIAGDTTEGILNRIDSITKSNPRKIFIMVGINDIGDGVSSDETIKNYKSIIDSIKNKSPKTEIYIQSILPCNSNLMDKNERNERRNIKNITKINEKLINLANSEKCIYIDLYKIFKDSNNELDSKYSIDGIHLNSDGYMLWKKYIYDYINN